MSAPAPKLSRFPRISLIWVVPIIGLVKDLKHVVVRLQLRRDAKAIAREGAQFWIVQPEIGFGGISGLDTLLSGAHMGVRLGDGAPTTNFRGLDTPPVQENIEDGRAFILRTDRLGGLQVHAPRSEE